MANNKVLTKISELNLKNERAKLDVSKQFPVEQQVKIWIYELTRFDNSNVPFVANTGDGVINIAGYKLVKESILYVESEFKNLFTESGTQLEITDNRNVYGYIQDDLEYDTKSYFISFGDEFNDRTLQNVFMIDNNNQYDEMNLPEVERVQIKPMPQELSFSNTSKWMLIPTEDKDSNIRDIIVGFKNPDVALSGMNVSEGDVFYNFTSKGSYLPFPIVPVSIVNKEVSVYSPWTDPFLQGGKIWFGKGSEFDLKNDKLKLFLGALYDVFINVASICHMVQNGFAGVKEAGFAPGAPSIEVKPSAGWYWRERLLDKDPKTVAAEIQSLIDLNLQAMESGEVYAKIDTNNVNGNIRSLTAAESLMIQLGYEWFFSLLSGMYPQIFSNYTYNYGGGFDGDAMLPWRAMAKSSDFVKAADGSEMYRLSKTADLTVTSNFSGAVSSTPADQDLTSGNPITVFYYEGSFNHRNGGDLYIIDYKNAEKIQSKSSTGDLRNAQNRMITSAGAVNLGKVQDWTFVNNAGWRGNTEGLVQIPKEVFVNMANPVFYYALTEDEINDYYNEGQSFLNNQQALWNSDNPGTDSFERGYPKVPNSAQIQSILDANPLSDVEYFLSVTSYMRDDWGSNNDYKLVLSDFEATIKDVKPSKTKIVNPMFTRTNFQIVKDGFIPYLRPADSLTASSIGKTISENSDVITKAPRAFIGAYDLRQTLLDSEEVYPYSSLSHTIQNISGNTPQTYDFESENTDGIPSITSLGISTLGAGTMSITFKYVDGTERIIDSANDESNIYSNNLYVDSDEDFVNTSTLINFGEEN